MRFSTFIVAVATTLAIESVAQSEQKINMSCKFAADHTGMVQYPYCCRDMQPAKNNAKSNEATDCTYHMIPRHLSRTFCGGPQDQPQRDGKMLTYFLLAGQLLTEPQLCEDQSRPACCYTIVRLLL